jgi:quinolinate synthase
MQNDLLTADAIYAKLHANLAEIVPDVMLRRKAEAAAQIEVLKRERNAIVLGHNYMEPSLFHSIPDYRGDSLELSRVAATTAADIIVFCGVRFMAETAKILNPSKTVLIPSSKAGCSLAESITAQDVRDLRAMYPGVPIVTYINTYADVKAECDICCTSGNAVAVVESLGSEQVIFLPDEFLARNVARETGKHIIFPVKGAGHGPDVGDTTLDVKMIGWRGRCEVHEQFNIRDIKQVRSQVPDVLVLSHPECSPDVVEASDYSGSTTAMIRYVEKNAGRKFLILTECSMADNILASAPQAEMLRMCSVRCPHMAEITVEDTLLALLKTQFVVDVPEDIRVRAYKSVERMLQIGHTGPRD